MTAVAERRSSRIRLGIAGYLAMASVVLFLVSGIVSPRFLTPANALNLLKQAVPLGIIAIGQTMAILTGGVDLSVGSVAILSNVVAAALLKGADANNLRAIFWVLMVAGGCGLLNAVGITKLGIPAFVMTLGTGIIAEGAALVYTRGAPSGGASPYLRFIGNGKIGIVPVSFLLWILLSIGITIVLRKTVFGRKIYAVGANKRVAGLSGVNVDRVIIAVYILSSITAAISGLVVTGYIGTGTLDWGEDYRLRSMASVVMGGTPFSGGVGGYPGTFASVLVLTVLSGLLTILNVSEPVRRVIYGLIILGVLAMSSAGIRVRKRGLRP
jgi:ribose/xylose/arabinose/galactoside ABC-type transport system permease subunit